MEFMYDRCTVVKIGGSLQEDGATCVIQAVKEMLRRRKRIVVVHGGGPRITAALNDAGIPSEFANGQRVTRSEAMSVVERVLVREVNPEIVAELRANEVLAVGLSGAEGILLANPSPGLKQTGKVERVCVARLMQLLTDGMVPVVAPVGVDESGARYNINADLAAAAIAGELGAERIVFLTDVRGIYANWEQRDLLYDSTVSELRTLFEAGRFATGMIPKVNAVLAALSAGVEAAFVVHGKDPEAIDWAMQVGSVDVRERDFGTRIVS